jgi:hypothetical protein
MPAAARGLRFGEQHRAVDVLARRGPHQQVGDGGPGYLRFVSSWSEDYV